MKNWQWTVTASGALFVLIIIVSFEYWLDERITRVEELLRSEDTALRLDVHEEEQALRGEIVRGFDIIEARLNNTGQPETKKVNPQWATSEPRSGGPK